MGFLEGALFGIGLMLITFIWLAKLAYKLMEQENEKLTAELKELTKEVPVLLEQHNGVFYLFESSTDKFVAQGRNMEELKAHISGTKYRNSHVYLVGGDKLAIDAFKNANPQTES